jgi:hypothetical protein
MTFLLLGEKGWNTARSEGRAGQIVTQYQRKLVWQQRFEFSIPDLQIERVDACSADLDQDVTSAQLGYGDIDFVDTVAFTVSLERKCFHRVSSLLVVDADAL